MKTLFQCDFDGTITREDVSFLILDAFGDKGWRQLFQEYTEGKISVGRFNTLACATVKADKETLLTNDQNIPVLCASGKEDL